MLKVKIEITDNNGKSAKIEINESDRLSNLVIISKVFDLFGIKTDVFEMIDTYNKIGKAYSSFFEEVAPIEDNLKNDLDFKIVNAKERLIKGLIDNKEEDTYKATEETPDYVTTGIKIRDDGVKLYRCFYKCSACYHKGMHYIYEFSKTTFCHNCQLELTVHHAHPEGFPNRDSFGNFFRAGDFKDWNMEWKLG